MSPVDIWQLFAAELVKPPGHERVFVILLQFHFWRLCEQILQAQEVPHIWALSPGRVVHLSKTFKNVNLFIAFLRQTRVGGCTPLFWICVPRVWSCGPRVLNEIFSETYISKNRTAHTDSPLWTILTFKMQKWFPNIFESLYFHITSDLIELYISNKHVLTILAWTKCRLVTKHELSIKHFHSCFFHTFSFKIYLNKNVSCPSRIICYLFIHLCVW